ncbi:MAG: beta-lactamase family protein [Gammaproteobacteria bacterium]|jgi:CubicO group peptidase (beta-lactamase class C family)|nr:beta-lactamase family protein [Gammaproteobacteria bacterium]MBT7369385.1 beta-lactamase family protein [Gammaproteobacteria bacterium]
MKRLIAVICTLVICQLTFAEKLGTTRPERMGMSSERLERVNDMSRRYVEEGKLAGAITMINRGGKIVHFEAIGNRGADDPRPLEKDDLFRIYSMSKPITAVAAMQLYEQGKFYMDDPVSKFAPELADLKILNEDGEQVPVGEEITMHQILTHTAGLSYGFNPQHPVDKMYNDAKLWEAKDLTEWAEKLAKLPLMYKPGERWHYSVAVDVTGLVIERISGMPFDQYLEKNIFAPLGMDDTFFEVPEDKTDRFLPNHFWNAKAGELGTMPVQNNTAMSDYMTVSLHSGGGGLVSSTMDYMRFCEMLRNGGTFNGARILSPKTIKFMTSNHLTKSLSASTGGEDPIAAAFPGVGFGLGFGITLDPVLTQTLGSAGNYSWGGAAGTVFWIDPVEDMIVIGMIQLMGSPWNLRQDLGIAAYQSILETNE